MKWPSWTSNQHVKTELAAIGQYLHNVATTLKRTSGTLFGISPDGKRDYNTLFGYGVDLSYQDYFGMYARGGIAHTVVDKLPKACWRDLPRIETGDPEDPTIILGEELEILRNKGLFAALERTDILNRIGNFAVMYIGVPDGLEPKLPVGSGGVITNTFYNSYSYDGTTISQFDTNPMSERFGRPDQYTVQTTSQGLKRKDVPALAVVSHWSRIVHMAEGALDSSVEGCSALQAPWNALIDIFKFRGSAGESFYRGSRQRTELRAKDGAKIDQTTEGIAAFEAEVQAWTNGYQDYIRTQDMEAHIENPSLESPLDGFTICMEEIAGITGMPLRILTGKGGGQLVGAEDRATWNSLIADRQLAFCSPRLLDALGVLAEAGMLELPDDARVVWPVNPVLNETEQAEVTSKRATAVNQVAAAVSTIGGDDIQLGSALEAIGLGNIELNEDAGE